MKEMANEILEKNKEPEKIINEELKNYVFNYNNIFSVPPLDYQYSIIMPIAISKNYHLTFCKKITSVP